MPSFIRALDYRGLLFRFYQVHFLTAAEAFFFGYAHCFYFLLTFKMNDTFSLQMLIQKEFCAVEVPLRSSCPASVFFRYLFSFFPAKFMKKSLSLLAKVSPPPTENAALFVTSSTDRMQRYLEFYDFLFESLEHLPWIVIKMSKITGFVKRTLPLSLCHSISAILISVHLVSEYYKFLLKGAHEAQHSAFANVSACLFSYLLE